MATSMIRIKKVCEFCGKEFIAQKASTRYCSKTCNSRAYKYRLRVKKVQCVETEVKAAIETKPLNDIQHKALLTVQEAGVLIGVTTRSVYNLIYAGALKATKLSSRMTLIRRSDVEAMLDANPYAKRHKRDRAPITEFYSNDELREKFDVSLSWIFKVGKDENVPKIMRRGKTLWSKKHFDAILARRTHDESITEWYSVEDMRQKFGMTLSAVYSFVYSYGIPKKKVKREVFYSKRHVDTAKGVAVPAQPEYYTIAEAMEKYGLTRDQLYHYVKWHKVPKVQDGRYVKIAKKELDDLLAPPVL